MLSMGVGTRGVGDPGWAPTCNDGGMADPHAITATIIGRVQGVGYRYTTAHMARELGLNGWVRNAPDGSVEVWAQGDEGVLEQFIAFLKQGPTSARVRSAAVHPVDPNPAMQGFTVRS